MNKEQQEAAAKLAKWLLNPDGGGYSVGPWERDLARMVIGLQPVECVPKIKPRVRRMGQAWMCSKGGIVSYPGSTPLEAYRNWLFGGMQ
jgi:ABC-type glycerol-3-phosphate transport system substrate-binding protein